jgi:capsule polysaccharide export protein KpsE/RkpR
VVQTEIAQLGFLKNDLTSYDEASQHTLREAELTLEFFTEQLTTATSALDLIRAQNQRLLKEHQNEVRAEVLALKVGLDEMKIDLSLLTHLTRKQIEENAQIALSKNETADVGAILATELQNIKEITTESDGTVATVKAGAKTIASTTVSSTADKWIGKLSGP